MSDNPITTCGVAGLENLGNTCYMNSALQCLSANDLFVSYLRNKGFADELRDNMHNKLLKQHPLYDEEKDNDELSVTFKDVKREYRQSATYSTYKLLKHMWNGNNTIVPHKFKLNIGQKSQMFRGSGQQDSQEFVNFLLDTIHEELKTDVSVRFGNVSPDIVKFFQDKRESKRELRRMIENNEPRENIEKKQKEIETFELNNKNKNVIYKHLVFFSKYVKNNHSIIIDIFTGVFMNIITCIECNNEVQSFEPFNILSLPIPMSESATLNECLDTFSKSEKLEGDEQYYCNKCNKKNDAMKKIYIWEMPEILIIQFKRFNHHKGRSTKNNCNISYPVTRLKLDNNHHEYKRQNYEFNLTGVVYHMGSLNGGHYIAFTQNPMTSKWYRYNDSNVTYIPREHLDNEIQTPGAYILFYKKKIEHDHDVDDVSSIGTSDISE